MLISQFRLGSNPEKLFPYEALLDQLQKFGNYATFVGTLLLPMTLGDIGTFPDLNDLAENRNSDSNHDDIFLISDDSKQEYNQRVTEMFDDMARFGYI